VGAYARIQTANNARLGFPASWIYKYGAQQAQPFHDVTSGSNGAYSAAPGWDYTTGFGSFDVAGATAFTLTSTAVSVSPTTVAPGASVTLTATVTGNAPTGTVQFQVNGAALGAPATLNGGIATLTTALPGSAGTDLISATYGGDLYNAGSVSATPFVVSIGVPPVATLPMLPQWAAWLLASILLVTAAKHGTG